MTLGEKIYKYRKQAGLSQEELAYKTNVTRQSVSLWETDQTMPSLESLITLSEIFSVSLDDLCGTAEQCAEPEAPHTAETAPSLACAQTSYTRECAECVTKISVRKYFVIYIVALALSVFMGISIIFSDADNVVIIIPIILIVAFAARLIYLGLSLKKRAAEFLEFYPNGTIKISFFQDYLEIDTSSDNTVSKSTVRYTAIKKVVNADKYILVYYGTAVVPIEKNLPDTNYDLILKLLCPSGDIGSTQNKKIKTLLLTMFILSLSSILLGLAAFAIAVSTSPIPDFPYGATEYMWIFMTFVPLPLASLALGIVFSVKNYKCKKNVIAGAIMCVLLVIYGSFTFIFKDYSLHNFDYVRELEQTVSIDLPDSGYLSRAKDTDDTTKSFAMIKFDDSDGILSIVSTDARFNTDMSAIPSNFLSAYHASLASSYNYFMLFDATDGYSSAPAEGRRYIFIAYHIDRNILLAVDFIKYN